MSSIPNAKMKHAHADEGADVAQPETGDTPKAKSSKGKGKTESLTDRARELGGRVEELAEDAVDAVKARPKTAAAIGAAIVAGAAALIGGPAAARALKGDDAKKPAAKKAPAKKKG